MYTKWFLLNKKAIILSVFQRLRFRSIWYAELQTTLNGQSCHHQSIWRGTFLHEPKVHKKCGVAAAAVTAAPHMANPLCMPWSKGKAFSLWKTRLVYCTQSFIDLVSAWTVKNSTIEIPSTLQICSMVSTESWLPLQRETRSVVQGMFPLWHSWYNVMFLSCNNSSNRACVFNALSLLSKKAG